MDNMELYRELQAMSLAEKELLSHIFNISFDEIVYAAEMEHKSNFTSSIEDIENCTSFKISEKLMHVVPPILLVLGTFGNIMAFKVLGCFKHKESTNVFLRVLAILDTNVLWFGMFSKWANVVFGFDINIQHDVLCKFMTFMSYTCSVSSVWIMVVLTFERCIAVNRPLAVGLMFNNRRLPYVIATPLVFIAFLHGHLLVGVGVVKYSITNVEECTSVLPFVENIWPWVDALVYCIIPCFLLLLLNGLIIRKLLILDKCGKKGAKIPLRRCIPTTKTKHSNNNKRKTRRTTTICVVISVFFIITVFPTNIMAILAMFCNRGLLDDIYGNAKQTANLMLAYNIASLLMYTNHAFNFFLYIFAGSRPRTHIRRLLKKFRKHHSVSTNEHTRLDVMSSSLCVRQYDV